MATLPASPFDAGEDRISFEREESTGQFGSDLQPLDPRASTDNRDGHIFDGNLHVLFMGKHIEEPAEAAGDKQNCAENGDGNAGDEAAEQERDTEGENNRPRSGSRQHDCCWCFAVLAGLCA
jgi:hypothetical protein